MKLSDVGLNLIKSFEGCHLTAYKCPAGVWTIGYGHTAGVTKGMKITQAQADSFLKEDCARFEKVVNAYDNIYHFNQNEFDALVSFTYNCGSANFKSLTDGGKRSKQTISNKILLYNKAAGIVLRGLTRRREAERNLFLTPITITKQYYPTYTGQSDKIDEVLQSIGATKDYDNSKSKAYLKRIPIAKVNGIAKYTGTAMQNLKLIALAKNGKLVKV